MLRELRRAGGAAFHHIGGAMKRISLLAGGALALFAVTASAVDHQVIARNGPRVFDPATLEINVGDTVTFINDPDNPGFHNATSNPDAVTQFRCANGCDGTGGNGDPSGDLWTATVTFDTPGTVGYYCEIHGDPGGGGMAGVITVVNTGGAPSIDVTPGTLAGEADEGASTVVPMSIGNTGDADLTWAAESVLADCAAPEAVPWLTLDPTAGTVASGDPATTVNVTMDAAGLLEGVYNAIVCVDSNDTLNALVQVPVAFTVTVGDRVFENGFDP
jgi:plastocyanin